MNENEKIIEVELDNMQQELDAKQARLQELDIKMEEYERMPFVEDLSDEEYKVYLETKKEYKALKKELKAYKPKAKDSESMWDHIPLWLWIVAILFIVINVYPVNPLISIYFAQWLLNQLPVAWANNDVVFYGSLFILPAITVALTLGVFFKIRKTAKYMKVYYCFMIIIGVLVAIGIATLLGAVL